MPLFVLGLNHTTAPLALRERVAFAPTELTHVLPNLQKTVNAQAQIALLSTCNRAEVYAILDDEQDLATAAQRIQQWLADYHSVPLNDLKAHTYVLFGSQATAHAFSVASGMDSMVLGEPQILGQMKQAIRLAHSAGTSGTGLQQWFDKSFAVAKEVRTLTEISAHSVSMAAASVKLARQVFESFANLNVLLVGAGEMMEVVAAHMAAQTPASLTVANRSLENAHELLTPYPHLNTHVLRLAELPEQLHRFDVVITCTASTLPIIGQGMVEAALKLRRHRPVVMVDLGVPRDIELAVSKLSDIYLYTVDDLSSIVQHNSAQRTAALAKAQKIVDFHVGQFSLERSRRQYAPQIQNFRSHIDAIRQQEISHAMRAFKNAEHISAAQLEAALQQMSRRFMNKVLHQPTIGLRSDHPATRDAWQTATRTWLNDTSEQ